MTKPHETEARCRRCQQWKPVAAYERQRRVCRPCRTADRYMDHAVLSPYAPTDFNAIPKHEYTEADRAWQAADLPVFNRGPLTWRLSA